MTQPKHWYGAVSSLVLRLAQPLLILKHPRFLEQTSPSPQLPLEFTGGRSFSAGVLMDIQFYWRDRLFEWVMASAMIGFGVEIMIWPSTIQASAFHHILNVISAPYMSFFFVFFGMLRVAALVANGNWPKHGPHFRAAGAGVAAMLWGQLGMSLLLLAPVNHGIPSPGIPVYAALVLGELVSAYRAITDARPPP